MSEPAAGEHADLGAPVLVRVAGLSADAMDDFHSDACAALLARERALRGSLVGARERLAERLFAVVSGAPPEARGFLIEIKRDCHNGRPLARRRGSPRWSALEALAAPLADEVIALERSLDEARRALTQAHDAAADGERARLARLAMDAGLLRGATLASASFAENLPRFSLERRNKRQARLEIALLRFASRAALKTSPFSSLTRVGLGLLAPQDLAVEGTPPPALRLVGEPWQERSLVEAKRFILDQSCALLLRYAPLRDTLRVALNQARSQPSPGRFCLVRPGRWTSREGAMSFTHASLAQVDLGGPLVLWLLDELAGERPTWAELCARAERTFASGEGAPRVRATLDKLLEIGFLRLVPPWAINQGDLAARVLAELLTLPEDAALAALAADLERLVAVERGYASWPRPIEALREMERLVEAVWEGTCRLLAEPKITRYTLSEGAFYEAVFLAGAQGQGAALRPVVTVTEPAVREAIHAGRQLSRLAQLFAPEHDFLLALGCFAERAWPDRREVELIELARKVQPLWQAYGRFLAEGGAAEEAGERAAIFDPFGLEAARSLRELRAAVLAAITRGMRHGDDESCLDPGEIEAALASVPARYAPSREACLMLQPADAAGRRWVQNQMFEGTGRYGSRYTPVMPDEVRRHYTAHLAARARLDGPRGGSDLLDVACTYGETLNVHAAQTRVVLELNDEPIDAPAARVLSLGDLRVRFDGHAEPPRVVDREGRALSPVHLGGADRGQMPFIVRLLAQFGPPEIHAPPLPRPSAARGAVTVRPRLLVGPLIVRRRSWAFPASALPAGLHDAARCDAFVALNHFRLDHGIPERVFMTLRRKSGRTKPQYIDFTSPHFSAIFITSAIDADADADAASVTLEEMLPTPEAAPTDAAGQRWVVELHLDTLALRAASSP